MDFPNFQQEAPVTGSRHSAMELLVHVLHQVPNVVWAAVIGTSLTLIGVWVSNRGNTKRLLMQLKHDSSERQLDRISTLHRSIYLEVAEQMVKATDFLGSIPHIDPLKTNIASGLNGFAEANSKLQVIAKEETAELATALLQKYLGAFGGLLPEAQPVHAINIEIEQNDEIRGRWSSEMGQILSEMKSFTNDDDHASAVWDVLNERFEHCKNNIAEIDEKQRHLYSERASHLANYQIKLLDAIASVAIPAQLLLISIRSEFGLETDKKKAEAAAEMAIASAKKAASNIETSKDRKNAP